MESNNKLKDIISKLYRLVIRQRQIDKGQLGGLIMVFASSLVILSPFTFIGILTLNYDRYIKYWIDIYSFIFLSLILFIIYEWIYFSFVYPSIIRFSNNQTYIFDNPLYDDVKEMKNILIDIQSKIKKDDL